MAPPVPGPETRLPRMVFPPQTNHYGTLFGGEALRLMDEAAFIAASRWARRTLVTVAVERIDFTVPIRSGELADAVARVVAIGRTSMVVSVDLMVEGLASGERRRASSGRFSLVAVDPEGRPIPLGAASV